MPDDHPFWTEKECNGSWEHLGEREVKETCLDGPALCFSNHGANGETILRTGKIVKVKNDDHGMWNYSKLCFNTKYPWEAGLQFEEEATIKPSEVESQQYVLKDEQSGEIGKANTTFWNGIKNECLYRRQFFNYTLETEQQWTQAVNLADFTVPYGVMRVDKLRLFRRPVSITLGSYGFPDNGTKIIKKELGKYKAIILQGTNHCGKEHQMAMTIFDGWEELSYVTSTGSNADSEHSIIIYAKTDRKKQYGGFEPYCLISQVITKESLEEFTEEELFPIKEVLYEDRAHSGAYGIVTVCFKDGTRKRVNYEEMEGSLML